MNATDIEQRLRTITAGQQADPDLADAITRGNGLHRQAEALAAQRATLQHTIDEHELAVEVALLAGNAKADDRAIAKMQDEIHAIDRRLTIYARAQTEAERRVGELEQARAARTEALLRPIFVDLVAQVDEQAETLAESERLLALAHVAAATAIPSGQSSPLTDGYCVFVPEQRLAWWRERVIRAGLLPAEQRVA